MARAWSRVNRWLTWFHRWAGVALCLFFAMWFASGAVLHFVSFPALSPDERRFAGETIEVSRVAITPSEALAMAPAATELRLVSISGRPVYLAQEPSGAWTSIDGETGDLLPPISPPGALAIAEAFARQKATGVSGPLDYDQWIVHQRFDPFRPLYRVRLADADQTDLYISARTGEVLQRTNVRQRAWNWCGAVIHWLYFTPLRKNWSAWNQVVWWLSLVALLSSAVGTWLGFMRTLANRAAGRKGLSPFRGWMRWHHIIGLFASVLVITWMLSGWLSMDHGRFFSHAEPSPEQARQMSGLSPTEIAHAIPLSLIQAVGPATEMTFNAVGGTPFIAAYNRSGAARIYFSDGVPQREATRLPAQILRAGLDRVWPSRVHEITRPDANDEVYRLAESVEGAAVFAVGRNMEWRVYVDPLSGRLLAVMDASRRSYAWIYYALHTFQFPGLISHPQIRTALVLLSLTLGFVASVTGVVLSAKRLWRESASISEILKPMTHPARKAL